MWEINEAFAGVLLASVRDLDISLDDVNGMAVRYPRVTRSPPRPSGSS